MDARTKKILERLSRLYPKAKSALRFSTPLEALVAAILAAQCTDERVNKVTATLFNKYRSPEDYAKASPRDFLEEIRNINFFRSKAKNIQACCRTLVQKYGGEIPRSIEEMLELPGVGRKTANMVLGASYGIPGLIVDTHVIRLAYRLGLSQEKKPEKIEIDLQKVITKTRWTLVSHQLSAHGRTICKARKPLCSRCALQDLCPKRGVAQPS